MSVAFRKGGRWGGVGQYACWGEEEGLRFSVPPPGFGPRDGAA